MGVLKALPQSCHSASCPVKGSSTGGTPQSGFSVFFAFVGFAEWSVLRWPECKFCHQHSKKTTSNPMAGRRLHTQLGTINGWPLAHKELLCHLTGFVFNPPGCPYPYTLLTKKPYEGDGLVTSNSTMKQISPGLHHTWPDIVPEYQHTNIYVSGRSSNLDWPDNCTHPQKYLILNQ